MTNPISGASWTNLNLGNGNGNGNDHDRDIIEGGADDDVVVARSEDRVITDRETGVSGRDLVVDGDMQDRMEETMRKLR